MPELTANISPAVIASLIIISLSPTTTFTEVKNFLIVNLPAEVTPVEVPIAKTMVPAVCIGIFILVIKPVLVEVCIGEVNLTLKPPDVLSLLPGSNVVPKTVFSEVPESTSAWSAALNVAPAFKKSV